MRVAVPDRDCARTPPRPRAALRVATGLGARPRTRGMDVGTSAHASAGHHARRERRRRRRVQRAGELRVHGRNIREIGKIMSRELHGAFTAQALGTVSALTPPSRAAGRRAAERRVVMSLA